MSLFLIQRYDNQLAVLTKASCSTRESVVRAAFKDRLKGMGRPHVATEAVKWPRVIRVATVAQP